jgi:hypothetical protein
MEIFLEVIALMGLLSVAIIAYIVGLVVAMVTEELLLGGAAFVGVVVVAYYFWQYLSTTVAS